MRVKPPQPPRPRTVNEGTTIGGIFFGLFFGLLMGLTILIFGYEHIFTTKNPKPLRIHIENRTFAESKVLLIRDTAHVEITLEELLNELLDE